MQQAIRIVFFIFIFILFNNSDVLAQKKKSASKNKLDITEKIWYGVNIGNPYLYNNVFGFGFGPMVGYHLNNRFSAGITSKFNYQYNWNNGLNPLHFWDYSAGVFGRAKILFNPAIFIHSELSYTSLELSDTSGGRVDFPTLFIGAGYSSGFPVGFEVSLVYDVLGNLALYGIPIEYRFAATYNF